MFHVQVYRAVLSITNKKEFLKQLENIVEGVKLSKRNVDGRLQAQKQKRDQFYTTLQGYTEQQRHYVFAVRQLGIECKKHENILGQS